MDRIGKPSDTQDEKIRKLRLQIEAYTQRQKRLRDKPKSVKVIRRRHYED